MDYRWEAKLYQKFRTFFDDAEHKRRWNPLHDVPWDKVNPEAPEALATCAESVSWCRELPSRLYRRRYFYFASELRSPALVLSELGV